MIKVKRALVSVYDKTGIEDLGRALVEDGVELVSSGGTATALAAAGLPVTKVADVTGAPEMLGGRVKTLHPSIHGGILANLDDPHHRQDLADRGVTPFELVVVNLYPFRATVAHPGVTEAEAIEKIDIGGPAMVRSAAKNHQYVAVVTDPSQYEAITGAVSAGGTTLELRKTLAKAAFFHTASYDAAIVDWLEADKDPPARKVIALERRQTLRYGENPHQVAAAFSEVDAVGWWQSMTQLQGKAMSFNNYLDTEAAWRMAYEFEPPTVTIIKHANPCGLATDPSLAEAFSKAWDCDPASAFGSVIAFNRMLDVETAGRLLAAGFVEVVIAPSVADGVAELFAKKKNLRLITAPEPSLADLDMRRIEGGFVMQGRDAVTESEFTVVSERPPTELEMVDLMFAWRVAAHTKSNAIVVAKNQAAIGVGAGDQSRVGASERALVRAGDRSVGSVAASDAFFPFRDGIDALAEAGVTAIIEPGGSVRDAEVIQAADEYGVALVFTHTRHFRH